MKYLGLVIAIPVSKPFQHSVDELLKKEILLEDAEQFEEEMKLMVEKHRNDAEELLTVISSIYFNETEIDYVPLQFTMSKGFKAVMGMMPAPFIPLDELPDKSILDYLKQQPVIIHIKDRRNDAMLWSSEQEL